MFAVAVATALMANATAIDPATVRLTPTAITVLPSRSLLLEVQQLELATVGALIDRDTTTDYTPYAAGQLLIALPARTAVRSLKFYGAAPVTVYADTGTRFTAVSGLENINLSQVSDAWRRYTANTRSAPRACAWTSPPPPAAPPPASTNSKSGATAPTSAP